MRTLLLFTLLVVCAGGLQAQVTRHTSVDSAAARHPKPETEVKRPSPTEDEPEPDRDAFVDLEEEPMPIAPVERLTVYPEKALADGLEGKVVLSALISKTGKVDNVIVLESSNPIFTDSAVAAMQKARFVPGRQHGQPVRVWITRSIRFKLK